MSPKASLPKPSSALSPGYVLAAVLIWSLILYGLLAPPAPALPSMTARAMQACVNESPSRSR